MSRVDTAPFGMLAGAMRLRQESWLDLLAADPRAALPGSREPGLVFGGHDSPAVPPNLLRRQADDGRFLTQGGTTGKGATWASLQRDHFAIQEAQRAVVG